MLHGLPLFDASYCTAMEPFKIHATRLSPAIFTTVFENNMLPMHTRETQINVWNSRHMLCAKLFVDVVVRKQGEQS